MNSIKQHTPAWLRIKKFNLGANDIASLLGVGFNDPSTIIENKILGTVPNHNQDTQKLLNRGNRYETVVKDLSQIRNGIVISETGLKRCKSYSFITASPDGYCKGKNPLLSVLKDARGEFLTEFKVRREISQKIPMKYWVQIQVQMAVWEIDQCMYSENVIKEYSTHEQYTAAVASNTILSHGIIHNDDMTFYWSLQEYKEVMIDRNQSWWNSIIRKICGYWSIVENGRGMCETRSLRSRKRSAERAGIDTCQDELAKRLFFIDEKDTMIQPYMLSNYFRSDPLLDWLNMYGPAEKRDTEVNFFLTMIRDKNREFNKRVTDYIMNMHPGSFYDACAAPFELPETETRIEPHKIGVSFESIERTKASIAIGTPIIFNPCFNVKLDSYPYPFGGRADMIVKNKYLPSLLGLTESISAECFPDKYTIVNFKYATINLRADKTHLLNNSKQKVYKAHMWLLSNALAMIQEWYPSTGYIIGRKYDFTKRGVTYRITNAFQGVGTIDFSEIDKSYEDDGRSALDWLRQVRDSEAELWDPFQPCLVEMYPNMKNANDFPWKQYKTEIAQSIKDITLMYHCGPKVRNFAHSKGITEWEALTSESIVYRSGKLLTQIMSFVDAGKRPPSDGFSDTAVDRIGHKRVVKSRPCIEFYLDFEAIGNMYDDFSTFPQASNQAMIFLIGVIVVDNVKGTTNYTSYLIDELDHASERRMVQTMLDDFAKLRSEYDQDFSPVYFWSNAENYMLKRAMGPDVVAENRLVMVDLCKCFRDAGLILPGQLGYGLKNVAKTMHRLGLIKTIWDESVDVASGLNATIEAMKTYKHRDPEFRKQYFRNLIDYNYVDCKVMEEILEYVRECAAEEMRDQQDCAVADSIEAKDKSCP